MQSPLNSAVALEAPPGIRLPTRLTLLGCLFATELISISIWIDNGVLRGSAGLAGLIHDWGAWTVRLAVAVAFVAMIFGESKAQGELARISSACSLHGISWPFVAGHVAAMSAFVALSSAMFVNRTGSANALAVAWIVAGIAAIVLAACAFVPMSIWKELIRNTGDGLVYALAAGLIACALGEFAWKLWAPLSRWTFALVKMILIPFVGALSADAATFVIGTQRFQVQIAPECSGYEGMGLMLAFSSAWLWFLRRQWRFPNALLLIPAGVVAMFLLNAARIAALILIGNAGAPGVALGGFHSQAGWLAFNGVALAMCVAARHIRWLARTDATEEPSELAVRNPTAAYLGPFLAILVAAMVARAMSASFEWAYPLRVIAAGAVIWYFRDTYKEMDWRIGWPAIAAGAIVFAIWIGLEPLARAHPTPEPTALANAAEGARIVWILFRMLGAVITVPIAEEIAFRGFLMRRIVSSEFETVSSRSFAWLPFLISSAAFGMMHGERWLAGMIAGMIYALAMIRKGRIGEAIAAHAVTNAMIALWVLYTGNWQLW